MEQVMIFKALASANPLRHSITSCHYVIPLRHPITSYQDPTAPLATVILTAYIQPPLFQVICPVGERSNEEHQTESGERYNFLATSKSFCGNTLNFIQKSCIKDENIVGIHSLTHITRTNYDDGETIIIIEYYIATFKWKSSFIIIINEMETFIIRW